MPKKSKMPTKTSDLTALAGELTKHRSFLVTTHTDPDGDGVGSLLAFSRLLRASGARDVRLLMAAPVPKSLAWLPGADDVEIDNDAHISPVDCAVILDTSPRSRTGLAAAHFEAAGRTVVIDHHTEVELQADLSFVAPEYAAVGEIIAELFDCLGLAIDEKAALCMYVAQITDTGGYRFSNTNARTHRLAARFVEAGVDAGQVAGRVLDDVDPARFYLMRRVYETMEFYANGCVACATIPLEALEACPDSEEHTTNLANIGRNITGVGVSIVLRETAPGKVKVSARSRPGFSCVALAKKHGGGGHQAAAGFTLETSLAQAKTDTLREIKDMLEARE